MVCLPVKSSPPDNESSFVSDRMPVAMRHHRAPSHSRCKTGRAMQYRIRQSREIVTRQCLPQMDDSKDVWNVAPRQKKTEEKEKKSRGENNMKQLRPGVERRKSISRPKINLGRIRWHDTVLHSSGCFVTYLVSTVYYLHVVLYLN